MGCCSSHHGAEVEEPVQVESELEASHDYSAFPANVLQRRRKPSSSSSGGGGSSSGGGSGGDSTPPQRRSWRTTSRGDGGAKQKKMAEEVREAKHEEYLIEELPSYGELVAGVDAARVEVIE